MKRIRGKALQQLTNHIYTEDKAIYYINFFSTLIETLGYDPQCALLEVKLIRDGQVRRYEGVPEEVWYHLRENYNPDVYYRRNICGIYQETMVPAEPAACKGTA